MQGDRDEKVWRCFGHKWREAPGHYQPKGAAQPDLFRVLEAVDQVAYRPVEGDRSACRCELGWGVDACGATVIDAVNGLERGPADYAKG